MNISKKLHAFEKIIRLEAEEQNAAALSETNEKYDAARAEINIELNGRAERRFAAECARAELEKNKKVLSASAASKKTLIELRGRLTDGLFENAARRLADFTATPEYPEYILKRIDETVAGTLGDKAEISGIVFGRNDADAAEYVLRARGIPVSLSAEDFIGGFILKFNDGNASLDMTFKTKITEARKNYRTVALNAGDGA